LIDKRIDGIALWCAVFWHRDRRRARADRVVDLRRDLRETILMSGLANLVKFIFAILVKLISIFC
jgi:hypothetical protein